MKEILLTRGYKAIVDDEDYDYLNKFKWYARPPNKKRKTAYALRSAYSSDGNHHTESMHSVILGGSSRECPCDHIDGNGLNNQRSNLRIVTPRENSQNLHMAKASMFAGICKTKNKKKPWRARIRFGYDNRIHLGYFATEEEAFIAYQNACGKTMEELMLGVSE